MSTSARTTPPACSVFAALATSAALAAGLIATAVPAQALVTAVELYASTDIKLS
ncbi:hypothetical protein OG883_23365 [Streptomyces sp. NBC_01142]|uniref:hypothetical protein n=1 Tax=Streptomyces sp. NBC_01142 TaxID=2975865 RepID=UPI00225AA750|nr:hypothetical protein [Streptomyces sp. NBC_01142]MCX4822784.1 hypothetical protein [Streptomyces sp. NBC_01142]